MPNYIRSNSSGASYFFTVVSFQRRPILSDPPIRQALRQAIKETQIKLPFKIDAWILMPDHLHCIWTLPENDFNYSKRWGQIKRKVSLKCSQKYKNQKWLNPSKIKHRESTIWQRRFWEHQIRDEKDFNNHLDYIHYNPTKHGLCENPVDWPYSTIHRYIKEGKYQKDWCIDISNFKNNSYGE